MRAECREKESSDRGEGWGDRGTAGAERAALNANAAAQVPQVGVLLSISISVGISVGIVVLLGNTLN